MGRRPTRSARGGLARGGQKGGLKEAFGAEVAAEIEALVGARAVEATAVGLVGFFAPFLGCAAVARYVLGWAVGPSWLAGVALSTTSVAVVYAVMLELGLNRTKYGKAILAACFINDLGTVIALGLIFSPFTFRTLIFVAWPRLRLSSFRTAHPALGFGYAAACMATGAAVTASESPGDPGRALGNNRRENTR